MNTETIKHVRWFWPWQDAKEEAWLGSMAQGGWLLKSVGLPCVYRFERCEPAAYTYQLDYMPADKKKWDEYRQIFQDAGWEYVGEMSNWRYWRKQVMAGEVAEIFTDRESKIRKYQRLLTYMAFIMVLMVFLGRSFIFRQPWVGGDEPPVITAIYLVGRILYMVIIPIYVLVVVQLARRISQLKKKAI